MLGRNMPPSPRIDRNEPSDNSRRPFDRERYESFAGFGPKNFQKSDESLREDVCETLLRDTVVDASDIEVKVVDGVVNLSGTVSNRHEKHHAEEIIARLAGVREIQNQLRVLRSAYHEEGDEGFDARRW